MPYRVRSADGEVKFEQFADLEKAYRGGLVDPADEVLEEGREKWVKAGAIKLLAGSEPKASGLAGMFADPEKRWYLIATVLIAIGVAMALARSWWVAGVLGALVLVGLLAYTTRQSFKRKRSG
jgi:hypothetical protein